MVAVAVGLLTFVGAAVAATPAAAEVSDGTLSILVNRDEDGDGTYDSETDPPQPGIEVAVTDAAGASVRGITDGDGQFVLTGSDRLTGGRYLVTAAVPPSLSELVPVAGSETYAPFSTAVDLRTGNQALRLGVAAAPANAAASAPGPMSAPPPAATTRTPRFAVGDHVWQDLDRSGRQDAGEPPAAGISVQLLSADGAVLDSTVSSGDGRFVFDDLRPGRYAVRFAGVPQDFRLTLAGAGNDQNADSDPDYTGTTPPFTLDVGEPDVRPSTAADGVGAAYLHAGIDAGITPLRYAVGDRVWLDANSDGAQQPDEPPAAADVALLLGDEVVATTTTDPQGRYRFANLTSGRYRLRFTPGEHRRFTARHTSPDAGLDSDSDPDPRTGITEVIVLEPGAVDLVPAGEPGAVDADLANVTVSAGLVGAYAVGDTVWHDQNGNGVLDAGDGGLGEVRVELLDEQSRTLDRTGTDETGRFGFADLAAGAYRLRFTPPAGRDLVFTRPLSGGNTAVDSDADADGITAVVRLGDENPADTTVDAGLTATVNAGPPGTPTPTQVPADTVLSSTGGVAMALPIAGLALVLSGLSCLLAARRPNPF